MDWTNYLSQIGEFPSILLLVYSDLLKFYPRKPEDETFIVCFRRKQSYVKSPIIRTIDNDEAMCRLYEGVSDKGV